MQRNEAKDVPADVGGKAEVSCEAAAALLHVSRTYLNALIDEGQLPARTTPGGHRRIPREAVLAFEERMRAEQREGLDRLMDASRRAGLYDAELDAVPVRRKL